MVERILMERVVVLLGIGLLVGIAVACSTSRRNIRWGVVARALALQAGLGLFVLSLPVGKAITQTISDAVLAVIGYSSAGIDMVFGPLASDEIGFSFVVNVLPVVIFFSSLMAVLYHLRIMQVLVAVVGGSLKWVVGVSRVESLNAAANVFVGLTEAPLAIRPYLPGLSRSQLFCVMSSGVASVAGSVLAAYALMGIRIDYLLAASFMAAPGGLAMAKLLMPDRHDADSAGRAGHRAESETVQDPQDYAEEKAENHSVNRNAASPLRAAADTREANVILAAAKGATEGLRLAVNIGAMLIAFVALIALVNGLLGWVSNLFGTGGWTLQGILGWVFAPVMTLLGVPWNEAALAGGLFGEKLILNEFVAFLHFTDVVSQFTPRTEAVVTIALCGFANLSAIAVLLGGFGTLIPDRRDLIGRYGLRVILAGSLSNLMSAAMVSLFFVG